MSITETGNLLNSSLISFPKNSMNKMSSNAGELKTNGESFANIFAGALNSNSILNEQQSPSIFSLEDSINQIQQNLLSSFGLDLPEGGSVNNVLAQLTSQVSIDAIQANVLSVLQTSLFTSKPEAPLSIDMGNAQDSDSLRTMTDSGILYESSGLSALTAFTFGDSKLELKDAFDTFNIFQHIPIISAIYRDVSGQDLSTVSKLAGGYVYGGAIGVAFSALDLAIENITGTTINDTIVNFDYSNLFDNEEANLQTKPVKSDQKQHFSLADQISGF